MDMEIMFQKMSLALSYILQNQTGFSDEQALQVAELYPAWHVDVDYKKGQITRYDSRLYRCVLPHASSSDRTPDASALLWNPILSSKDDIADWVKPTGVYDAYNVGDVVMHNGSKWKSLANVNIQEPSDGLIRLWKNIN